LEFDHIGRAQLLQGLLALNNMLRILRAFFALYGETKRRAAGPGINGQRAETIAVL
jgi:hypothetical protein